ncbi:ABC transporter permease [Asaia spathodeae]|uniref:Transport permease protein n=1 Tax=Asaia spathodeae TaxID=657016 RepID=A0ABX2P0A4_9PROT|nr:ABC transporter permease [Asaia spathodeae]GBR15150.1 multidrug ABC transporter permease [Asaia spathodeae NBRC 105894]
MIDVLFSLWLRQVRGFLRARGRVFSALSQPFLFLIALGLGFAPVFRKAGEGDYFAFLAPGVIGAGILFNAVYSGADLLWDRQFGFIKETLVAPVSRHWILLGRALGVASVAMIQAIIVGAICLIFSASLPSPGALALFLLFALLIAVLCAFFGSILGSVMSDAQSFSQIVNFIITPVFYLSGAVFPLEGQSGAIRVMAFCNPLTYGIDGMRGALSGHYVIPPTLSFFVLSLSTLFAAGVAQIAFSRIRP